MQKKTIIKKIKRVITEWGAFGCGEVPMGNGVTINSMGDLVAIGEYFNSKTVWVEVFDTGSSSSDSIHTYEVSYEDLSADILAEILELVVQYASEVGKL
jgi:hypothetical protein